MSPLAASRRVEAAVPQARRRGVYLDYHASTPCDPRVVEKMLPVLLDDFANPASDIHGAGRRAAAAVETAREQVAAAIRAEPEEIVFTSGATESNNLAVLGSARARSFGRTTVLAGATEHKSVLVPIRRLKRDGFELKLIPVEPDGRIDLGALAELVSEDTFLVSVQAASNEIGTIQPILEIVQIAHAAGALVHCDAAQALGRMALDVGDWGVDLLSLSGHKCYGPKGIGALYVRGGAPRALLEPIVYGGGQEHGLRAGTLNVPGIVGFGLAAEIAETEREADTARIRGLRDWFERQILEAIPRVRVNGSRTHRVAGNSSLTFPDVEAEALIARLRDVHLSTGSACTSGAPEPSHVLTAIGQSREDAYNTVRIGLGRFTTPEELTYAAMRIVTLAGSSCAPTPIALP
ncbi:MAG: cysteine desulfurase [Gemmatimonadales bacterium]|nr:cysteine desulfurase [Gemmatimonadales bacterium]MYG48667.1 cysteine desulfurase [Gemmatimonadales bacterium]MYK02520.1 cysteine desulfurase [Candidatus Palauibacter ramosifaciens]